MHKKYYNIKLFYFYEYLKLNTKSDDNKLFLTLQIINVLFTENIKIK